MRHLFSPQTRWLSLYFGILFLAGAMSVRGQSPAGTPGDAPFIKLPSSSEAIEASISADYKTREAAALAIWKEGRKEEAMAALYPQTTDAPPADAAAAMLRLGYMNLNLKNREEALRLFTEVADMRSGINDAVKGEAAIRCANLQPSRELKRLRLERIVAGEYKLSNYDACEIALILGAMNHVDLKLQRSLAYYEAVAQSTTHDVQRAQAQVEAAGLVFEMAKGEGKTPIPESERPAAFQRARALCKEVMDSGEKAPESRRMVAELMYFETYLFEKDYETGFQRGKKFLEQWGTDPAKYSAKSKRIYINTAKTQLALLAYLGGHHEDALELASDLIANPPPRDEHYAVFDCLMYASVIGDLIAEETPAFGSRMDFQTVGRSRNVAHFEMLRPVLHAQRNEHSNSLVAQTQP